MCTLVLIQLVCEIRDEISGRNSRTQVVMSHANGYLQYHILQANIVVTTWSGNGDTWRCITQRLSDVHNEVATWTRRELRTNVDLEHFIFRC